MNIESEADAAAAEISATAGVTQGLSPTSRTSPTPVTLNEGTRTTTDPCKTLESGLDLLIFPVSLASFDSLFSIAS